MKYIFRLAMLVALILLGSACSESKLLMKGLSNYPQPLGYEFTSPIDSSTKADSVILTFNGFQFDSITTVHRKKGLIIPLIFINIAEYKYRIKLGASQFNDNYNEFFFNALIDESQRSGRYTLCYDSTRLKDVYHLEVTLDTCLTDTYLLENTLIIYYIYGYFSTYSEKMYPANSKLACKVRLRKGDQLIRDTTISVNNTLDFPIGTNLKRNEQLERTAGFLVESLCQSTRDCISEMVRDVNETLTAQKR
ncbi:MAG TPA: hypothetical protein VFP20_11535 [Bacteroidales bacterium]|nr:hypothetical protein [Bacteroidales bacterium]